MKIVNTLSALALASLLFVSCKDTSKDGSIETNDQIVTDSTQVKETAANLETTTFKIDGMTCAVGCAATIEKKLAKMDGVQEAKVNFETKEASVSFDPAKQTPEKFVETVETLADGAYKVSDVKSSGDKAYYSPDQEKPKNEKKKTEKKSEKKDAKSCSTDKKGGCCAAGGDAKKSCHGDAKGGSM